MSKTNETGPVRLVVCLALIGLTFSPVRAGQSKARIVVMTDIGGDPDDQQSMVRFLLYSCDFEVEGLCTGFGHGHYKDTRPELIRKAVDAYGKDGVKEGDTPSFLYVLPDGLSDPDHPEWGSWGGRFRRSGRGNEYVPAEDIRDGRPDMLYTISRWRRAYQNAFEARMDWCIKPRNQANHEPVAVCNGDKGLAVLEIKVEPGAKVQLSAAGSSDPDGDKLKYRWWVYREAGTYWADAEIAGADGVSAVVTAPREASGRTIHVILEVVDNGKPQLTSYRRVILKVAGQAQEPPEGAESGLVRRTKPVTKLSGPPAETGRWSFYRGININGLPIEIDGHKWDGDKAPNFVCKNRTVNSPGVRLWPPTDANRAKMIHSFRWDRRASIKLTGVSKGKYAVYAYVWEDNNPERITILLKGKEVAKDYDSGHEGDWRRLGPWVTTVNDGTIEITSRGGATNFSGIEIWRAAEGRGGAK